MKSGFSSLIASLTMQEGAAIVSIPVAAEGSGRHLIPGAWDIARVHWKSAADLFFHKMFNEAATEFLLAHELVGSPALLFNAAVCYEKAKAYAASVAFYEQYLQENPEARDRASVMKRIEDLRDLH
jgi:hypothetical protein